MQYRLEVARRTPVEGVTKAVRRRRLRRSHAWPDRHVEVVATSRGLLINIEQGEMEALPLDERTFLLDPVDADTRR